MSGARGGRLPEAIDQAMQRLNVSVDVDSALWREDIEGSIAHARGLEQAGVLSAAEVEAIVSGLERIAQQIERGELVWDPEREDVHMNIEARLIELVGPVGGKLHTGRSRNDQIATDLRLWAKKRTLETVSALHAFAGGIDRPRGARARRVDAGLHAPAARPAEPTCRTTCWPGRSCSGATAGGWSTRASGSTNRRSARAPWRAPGFALERESVASALGFARATRNSIDATGSRDFLMELAAALAILGVHLSRIGEEIVLWSSQEFGFLTLSDRFATSSSMMPQKKNPDVAELVRGRAARLIGSVVSLLALEKALPFGYGRDLQEDKRPILDAFESAIACLHALTGAIDTATFNGQRMRQALERGHLCATDLADFLVLRGLPFRDAHHVVGGLVREAETRGVELGQLPPETLKSAHACDSRARSSLQRARSRRSPSNGGACSVGLPECAWSKRSPKRENAGLASSRAVEDHAILRGIRLVENARLPDQYAGQRGGADPGCDEKPGRTCGAREPVAADPRSRLRRPDARVSAGRSGYGRSWRSRCRLRLVDGRRPTTDSVCRPARRRAGRESARSRGRPGCRRPEPAPRASAVRRSRATELHPAHTVRP